MDKRSVFQTDCVQTSTTCQQARAQEEDRPQGGKQAQTGGLLWTMQRYLPAHPAGEAAHLSLAFTRKSTGTTTHPPRLKAKFLPQMSRSAGIPKETKYMSPPGPMPSAEHILHQWTQFRTLLEGAPQDTQASRQRSATSCVTYCSILPSLWGQWMLCSLPGSKGRTC